MQIAICDDNHADREHLRALCASYLAQTGQNAEIHCYASVRAYLAGGRAKTTDLLLLDVYFDDDGMDGIDAARALRSGGFDGEIILITSSREHALDGYQVGAVHYLVKPVGEAEFAEGMRRAQKRRGIQRRSVAITSNRQRYIVALDNIFYLEVEDHKTRLTTKNGTLETAASLADTLALLDDARFLKCFRSCAVNMQHVAQMADSHFVMKNGEHIPIAKRELTAIKDDYMNYVFAHEKEG